MTTTDAPDATDAYCYRWTPPVYRSGQRVRFRWRVGTYLFGRVGIVETRYRANGEAWHCYSIMPDGHTRWAHVSVDEIAHLVPNETETPT